MRVKFGNHVDLCDRVTHSVDSEWLLITDGNCVYTVLIGSVEKAEELFDKFYLTKDERGLCRMNEYMAKQCALIAVEEMEEVYASAIYGITNSKEKAESLKSKYLQEVKKEIEKL
jgi:hypothetical protein